MRRSLCRVVARRSRWMKREVDEDEKVSATASAVSHINSSAARQNGLAISCLLPLTKNCESCLLVGNSGIVMIACTSPSSKHVMLSAARRSREAAGESSKATKRQVSHQRLVGFWNQESGLLQAVAAWLPCFGFACSKPGWQTARAGWES